MAVSINIVHVGGYLGRDPEIRKTGNTGEVVELSIGSTERWGGGGRGGEANEKTEWHRIVCFNEHQIDYADKFLRKGDPVFVTGKLQTRKYTDKDGNDRYTTEIVAFSIQGLGQAGGGGGGRGSDDRSGGRDRGGDRGGGGDRDRGGRGGRDDRGGSRGDDRDRGNGYDRGTRAAGGRDDTRGGGRGDDRGGARGRDDRGGGGRDDRGGGRADPDLDDEIPF